MNFSGHPAHLLPKILQKLLLKIKITVLLIFFGKILRFVKSFSSSVKFLFQKI